MVNILHFPMLSHHFPMVFGHQGAANGPRRHTAVATTLDGEIFTRGLLKK